MKVWKQEGKWEGGRREKERRQRWSEGERSEEMRKCEEAQKVSEKDKAQAGRRQKGSQALLGRAVTLSSPAGTGTAW